MLASLNGQHSSRSAFGLNAFKPQQNLCSFNLFVANSLSLPTMATLLPVIMPHFLHIQRILALVLCYFVGLVLATLPTESLAGSPCSQRALSEWKAQEVLKSESVSPQVFKSVLAFQSPLKFHMIFRMGFSVWLTHPFIG